MTGPAAGARAVATLGGVGLLRPAPGTWGSAAAVPLAWGLHLLGGFPLLLLATGVVTALGVWAIGAMTEGAADHDPSEAVIDEVAGQWVALFPLSGGLWWIGAEPGAIVSAWPGWVLGFALFRLFDVWKPGPVGRADRMNTPIGTVLDDLIAGALAALAVAALGALAHLVLLT